MCPKASGKRQTLKNFVLTTSKGLMLAFEIYQGEQTNLGDRALGLDASVILRMSNTVPKTISIYFDRYFTSIPLLLELKQRGIFGTGTLNVNCQQISKPYINENRS